MIELNRKYRTRDGRKVRIYAVDGGNEFPVHGAIVADAGHWETRQWPADGQFSLPTTVDEKEKSSLDLVECTDD